MAIRDRRGFADTLTGDISKLGIALEEELWLKNDLQVIIDPEGYVHVIDLTSPCVGSTCTKTRFTLSAAEKMYHRQRIGFVLNALRSLIPAITDGENADENELVRSCDLADLV